MISSKVESRFWSKVNKKGASDCWPWTACKDRHGYGALQVANRKMIATHVALLIDGRERPENGAALHSCDNPSCVNPSHLRWGTMSENMADKMQRGRARFSDRRGARNPNAKITEETVQIIRRDGNSAAQLAERFGLSVSATRAILLGKSWKGVPAAPSSPTPTPLTRAAIARCDLTVEGGL